MFKKILLQLILPCIAILIFFGSLFYYNEKSRVTNDNNELFQIIAIESSQVTDITFENIHTTEQYKINFVKQYCKNWESIQLGSQWNLRVLTNDTGKYILNAHLICGN